MKNIIKILNIRLIDVIYSLLLISNVCLVTFLFIKTQSFIHSEMFVQLAYTLVFFMTSILAGVCVKIYNHTYYSCPSNKSHREVLILLCRFFTWLLLFLGISYSLYMYEEHYVILYYLGYVVDGFVAVLLLLLFYSFIKILNTESKN
jgi:hypothetical protein